MNERQVNDCSIALSADGWDYDQIAIALNISCDRVAEFASHGANEQSQGTMGYVKQCPAGDGIVFSARDNKGNIITGVKRHQTISDSVHWHLSSTFRECIPRSFVCETVV